MRRCLYLVPMRFVNRLNPVGGIQDFWSEFRRPNRYRWPILGASALMTGGLFYGFTSEKHYYPPEKPDVTYISTYAPNRSDAEIAASNVVNQRRKDQRAAEIAAIEEQKRELYRALGRATGMDVDKIEADAAKERAREEAAAKQRLDGMMGQAVAKPAE